MRVVFMGTPDFSVGALNSLIDAGHQICACITQPDKPKNRGHKLAFSPVKEYALTKADAAPKAPCGNFLAAPAVISSAARLPLYLTSFFIRTEISTCFTSAPITPWGRKCSEKSPCCAETPQESLYTSPPAWPALI